MTNINKFFNILISSLISINTLTSFNNFRNHNTHNFYDHSIVFNDITILKEIELELFNEINALRTKNNLSILKKNKTLYNHSYYIAYSLIRSLNFYSILNSSNPSINYLKTKTFYYIENTAFVNDTSYFKNKKNLLQTVENKDFLLNTTYSKCSVSAVKSKDKLVIVICFN